MLFFNYILKVFLKIPTLFTYRVFHDIIVCLLAAHIILLRLLIIIAFTICTGAAGRSTLTCSRSNCLRFEP